MTRVHNHSQRLLDGIELRKETRKRGPSPYVCIPSRVSQSATGGDESSNTSWPGRNQRSRRICTYVLVEKRCDRPAALLTPPSSAPNNPKRVTRATASQPSLDTSLIHTSSRLVVTSRPSTHAWSFVERQTLCILKRMFTLNNANIAKLLNAMFPCPQQPFFAAMISSQYSFLRAGYRSSTDARAAYASIWTWNFDHLTSVFAYRVAHINVQAAAIQLGLSFRQSDCPVELCAAEKNRRHDPTLFRTVAMRDTHEERELTPASLADDDVPQPKQEVIEPPVSQFGETRHEVSDPAPTGQLELMELDDLIPMSSAPNITAVQFEPDFVPPLLFRFVSPSSAGMNKKNMIRASRFQTLPRYPIPRSTDTENLLWDAELHLARHHVASPYISTSKSLIWAIFMCHRDTAPDESKWIYIINGRRACEHTGVYHAKRLLEELRKQGRFLPKDIRSAKDRTVPLASCKYAGNFEYLVYGEVSTASILKVTAFAQIKDLARTHPSVDFFLRLHYFQNARTTGVVRSKMCKDRVNFDSKIGEAIARLMALIGITPDTKEDIICSTFYELVQGWCIRVSNNECTTIIAIQMFVTSLCSAAGSVDDTNTIEKLERAAWKALRGSVNRLACL